MYDRILINDKMEELLTQGPGSDEEAYELEEYVHGRLFDLNELRMQLLHDTDDLQRRYVSLGKEMDKYRRRTKQVISDFGW